ncbi:MAG: stage II sporulation protein M [Anaerolineae bacterium]
MQTMLTPTSIEETRSPFVRWLLMTRWNLARALIITRREVTDMLRDWRILAPIFILTVVFPFIANWGAGRIVNYVEQFEAAIIGERLIPFLLLVVGFFPISFSLIIALESFAGEKERRSLEPLLDTPLTDLQLYIGKILASVVPPLAASALGITVYLVGVFISVDYRPPLILLVQVFSLTAMQAILMVAGAVVVSSQATSVRAANLLASFIIIPVAFLIQLEAFIMFLAAYSVLWWVLLGIVVITVVLLRMGVRSFNREELLGRDIDELDLYKGMRRLGAMIVAKRDDPAQRRSPWAWYRDEVLAQVPRLWMPALLTLVSMGISLVVGIQYAEQFPIPEEMVAVEDWEEQFPTLLGEAGLTGVGGVVRVVFQNARAILIGGGLGMFTLGIGMVLVAMLPFGIIGFVFAQVSTLGIDPSLLYAALIPHSIIEIPAILLASAAFIRLGASVIAPPPDKTIGQGWMVALADTIRLSVGLVLPLFIIAAVIEVFITPQIVLSLAAGL